MRRLLLLIAVLTGGGALYAQAAPEVLELSGRLASAGPAPDAALHGALFRLTVSVDPAAAAASTQRDGRREVAVYVGTTSMLTISGASNAMLNGVFRGTAEGLEVADSFAGEDCLTSLASFQTPRGALSLGAVCFAPGTMSSTHVPSTLADTKVTGFKTMQLGGATYGVVNGAARIEGGAQ